MSSMLPVPPICPTCSPTTTGVPGPQGPQGPAGPAGANGAAGAQGPVGPQATPCYTTLIDPFTMPAEGATDTMIVVDTSWMAQSEMIGLQVWPALAGPDQPTTYLIVQTIVDGNQVVVYNPAVTPSPGVQGHYTTNAAPGTIFPSGYKVVAAGMEGAPEAAGTYAPASIGYVTIENAAPADLPASIPLNLLSSGLLYSTQDGGGVGFAAISTIPLPITIGRGGTGQTTATAGFAALSPMTTNGDVIIRSGGVPARLGIGTVGQVLTSNGTTPYWATTPSPNIVEYGPYVIPAPGGAIVPVAHGMGASGPKQVFCYFKCTDAGGDVSYALGDKVPVAATFAGTGSDERPIAAIYWDTNFMHFILTNSTAHFISQSTGNAVDPDFVTPKWELYLVAIR